MSILAICPSRERPTRAAATYKSFLDTKAGLKTDLLFALDEDDPTLPEYRDLPAAVFPKTTMVNSMNRAVAMEVDDYDIIGFVGDDCLFRTPGWDEIFEATLKEHGPGIVYGNDCGRKDFPGTHPFVSSSIIKVLGWFWQPSMRHLYVDYVLRDIGKGVGVYHFCPGVVIEHMHYVFGKADRDASYRLSNSSYTYAIDGNAYARWLTLEKSRDVAKVKAAIAGASA